MGSPGVGGPGEGARLPCADGDCGQRAVAGLEPAPVSAHRTERAGETSREPAALPRSDTMRICRGCLRAAELDGAAESGVRPRGSSSASVGEEDGPGAGKLGKSGASGGGSVATVTPELVEVDLLIGVGCGRRE